MPHPHARNAAIAALAGSAALLVLQAVKQQSVASRPKTRRLRVVIAGAGFGGLSAAKALADQADIDLTVIDSTNHHLFQPLLYQVATAALSPADIAAPLREILPAARHTRVILAKVTGVDTIGRAVLCADGERVSYDRLIVATGAQASYFGNADWEKSAPSLKSLEDALRLRNMGVAALERAALACDPAERKRALTFVLIGGGATGVEMAGAIGEFIGFRLEHMYGLSPRLARIVLVEAGERLLAAFDPSLSLRATQDLEDLGVEVRTGTRVTSIAPGEVHLGDEVIGSDAVIWTAGTSATPVATWLGTKPAQGGRVAVGADLSVPGHPDIAVIGDAALAEDADGHPLPGLAPVAKQQGAYVAGRILAQLRRSPVAAPFRYRDYGTLATIGHNKAVAELGSLKLTGRPAWIMWAGAHILFLISFRSRAVVSLEWAFTYATKARGAALLIPGEPGSPAAPLAAAE